MKRELLIKKREDKKLTQKQIAEIIGVTDAYYSMIESGLRTPSYKTMKKIADFFNVKPDYIFLK